ncbi:MAG: PQQ-binding-like beta-propeller repeat protein [Acidobacteriota bacterium]
MRRALWMALFLLVGLCAQAQTNIWQYNSASPVPFEPVLATDGSVYFATSNGKFNALTSAGILKWSVDPGGQVITPPVLQGNYLFFGTSSQELRAYSVAGNMFWRRRLGVNISTPLAVSAGGYLFFGTTNGYLYCVQAGSGVVLWDFHAGFRVVSAPVIGHDGTVYFLVDNFLMAVNPQYGTVKWSTNAFSYPPPQPLLLDSYDHIFFLDSSFYLNCFDNKGHWLWQAKDETGALLTCAKASPIIVGDNILVSTGSNVYAVSVWTGQATWDVAAANTSPAFSPAAASSMAASWDGLVYYCDGTTKALTWFNANTGALGGSIPSFGTGLNVNLIGWKGKGYLVIRTGPSDSILMAYSVPGGAGAGPWCQWGGTPYHLQRRDDAPFLELTSPLNGTVLTGNVVVTADAQDDYQLTGMSLYLNGTDVQNSSSGYLSWGANSAMFQDGTYEFEVVATDSGGNEAVATASVTFQNPPPVYPLGSGPPVFSWLSNGVDNKYQVAVSEDPNFASILIDSSTPTKKFRKITAWQPSTRKWAKVTVAAAATPSTQVTFYWRVVGKTGGLVVTRSFVVNKSL